MSLTPIEGTTPRDDGLVLLANESMSARRRPGTIVFVWLWESAVALLAAWPIGAVIHSAYGQNPTGDAPLWNPGAHEVMDLLQHLARGRSALVASVALTILVAAIAGVFPLATLLGSMAYVTRDRRAPRVRHLAGRALSASPAMLVLLALTLSVQGLVGGLGVALVGALNSQLTSSLGDVRADVIALVAVFLVVLLLAVLGVAQDLARAAVVRFRVGAFSSARRALVALRRAPFASFWSWAWRAAAAFVPVGVVALVAERLGGREGIALIVLIVLHQLTVLVRVALRASWLAKALRTVDQVEGRRA